MQLDHAACKKSKMALFGKNVPYFKEGQMVFPLISHLDF